MREKEKKTMAMREEAFEKLNRDCDVTYIVDTIYKIKAALKVIVADDRELISKMKYVYQKDKMIMTQHDYD